MIPTMIVTLGVQLSSVQKLELNVDTWIACGLRLLLAPLLAFGLAFLFPLGELEKNIGILQAAMPTAILAAIIAIEYDLIPDFVTTSVLLLNNTWRVYPDNPPVYNLGWLTKI
jgi:predicted permease